MDLPEWASLVRLTTDELVLIAYFRACPFETQELINDFARVSAETCKSVRGDNVIVLDALPKKTRR